MNAESTHLDLEELLAEVNGEAVSDLAREHLAACGRCHADALRWGTVAGGARELMTVSSLLPAVVRLPAQPGGKPRTTIVAAAAAAVLVLGGARYGLTAALTGHAASPAGTSTKTASLTAVTGCTRLKEASGTLAQLNGTSVVIKTASGQPVTLTPTAATLVAAS